MGVKFPRYTVYGNTLTIIMFSDGDVPCCEGMLGKHDFTMPSGGQSYTFNVTRGDYSPLMSEVVTNLRSAMVRLNGFFCLFVQ